MKLKAVLSLVLACCIAPLCIAGGSWSKTELVLKYGELKIPATGGGEADTTVSTLQHASGWDYGDNFFFIDYLRYRGQNGVKDNSEMYGEWYSNFSLGAISGKELSFGPVKDLGVVVGFNYAPEVDSWWLLPGIRFALDLPGFIFANLDVMAYQHHGDGDSNAGFDDPFTVIDEDDSFIVDFNWGYPFQIGSTRWSFEGHIEYIDGRDQQNNFGTTELESWVLAQPQLRFDLGHSLWGKKDRLFIGFEYQYWRNKLGEKNLDDKELQLLASWRF